MMAATATAAPARRARVKSAPTNPRSSAVMSRPVPRPLVEAVQFSDVGPELSAAEQAVVDAACAILDGRLRKPGQAITSPQAAKDLARLHMARLRHECFAVLFFDSQHRMVALERMFRGTLTQTAVYPREVVIAALRHGAAAVILAHNHPSGVAEPSRPDEYLTQALKSALAMVDVRVLDHLVVGGGQVTSFAERGLL